MSDAEERDDQITSTGSDAEATGAAPSNQRLRAILAGLVTVAILAVLAIAVFNGDDNEVDPPPAAPTTAASDGTGGEGVQDGEPGAEELGSLALSGYLCPEPTSEESECFDAGTVEISSAVVELNDGRTYSLEGVQRGDDGTYAWLNIPVGEYTLLAEGLTGPDGSIPRAVIGSTGQINGGWRIANLDPNQPAEIRVLFDQVGEGTAVG
ncbi:MAG: hypothetical protein AB7V46_04745 [Thermomicrobiales bacterium]